MPNVGDVIYAAEHARMGCTLRRVANQTLPDSSGTTISWDTEDADTNGLWSSGGTITLPAAGLWVVCVSVLLAAASTGRAFISMQLASGPFFRDYFGPSEDTATLTAAFTALASDTFDIGVFADTAAGTTMTGRIYVYRAGL